MPSTVDESRNQIEFEDVWNTGVIFSQKTSKGLLPKYRGREGCERGFMPMDVKVQESNIAIAFFFLSEGNGSGLAVQEGKERFNVSLASKKQECVINIPKIQ